MFNEKLKELRLENKLTQVEISKKLNVTQQTYSRYEKGTREPSIDIIKNICKILKCSADELLEIED